MDPIKAEVNTEDIKTEHSVNNRYSFRGGVCIEDYQDGLFCKKGKSS